MKISYIANARIPTEKAHGIQIMKMCEAFVKNGHELNLIVPNRRNNTKKDAFTYYDLPPTFKITKLPCLDLVTWGKWGYIIQTLTFLISTKFYLFFKKYDVLYSREPLSGIFFKDYILEVHSLPIRFAAMAGLLVVLTSFIKKELEQNFGIASSKIIVSPDGVDLEKFDLAITKSEAKKLIGLDPTIFLVLYSGHLFNWKGADTLASAANFLEDATFLFVGGTEKDIEKFKQKFGSNKNIIILGKKDHNEIPTYLKAADILVLPNNKGEMISMYYTSPLKLFEYMASKRSIIASRLPSLQEILDENLCYFFEPGDPNDLARVISDVKNNYEKTEQKCLDAYEKVKNYTWDKRVVSIIQSIK